MKFIDESKISVFGGKGGNGAVSWRREKFVPKGGPDGGNGGNGGAVILVADSGINTLVDFSFNPLIKAEPGVGGGPKNLHGRNGKDAVRLTPVGTQVYYEGELIADLSVPGARWVAARGGRGGKGNTFFKSANNRAPKHAQPGQIGDEFDFRLVLKSVADIGLVGFPNAGKSTLISRVSSATPKVADYPFTTIRPSLGVALLPGERRLVIADIPGIIEGAHEGKGLGIQFLKHIERTTVLAQLIDVSSDEELLASESGLEQCDDQSIIEAVERQFSAIDNELRQFSEEVAKRPRLVIFSKSDLPLTKRAFKLCAKSFQDRGWPVVSVSSVDGSGLKQMLEELYQLRSPVS